MDLTAETIDFPLKDNSVLALSIYYWSQFICEHTGKILSIFDYIN